MKILLIGEFSNVHWTLAQEFRSKGHDVTVVSSGDGWKNYKRDIDICFSSRFDLLKFLIRSYRQNIFRGYDIVQLINYQFFFSGSSVEYNKNIFNYLKKNNSKLVLGAYGDDYFYAKSCIENKFRYSPFDSKKDSESYANKVLKSNYTDKHKRVNTYIAEKSDLIIACMYEYYISYWHDYKEKLEFIPLPVDLNNVKFSSNIVKDKIKIFLGIQKERTDWKGTNVFKSELQKFIQKDDNDRIFELIIAENLPYVEYIKMYNDSNILFDQLYSYSLGMNGVTALAQGKIVFGGGEDESYDLMKETKNKPIVNISPERIYEIEEKLIIMKKNQFDFEKEALNSRLFVETHHDAATVAEIYIEKYNNII